MQQQQQQQTSTSDYQIIFVSSASACSNCAYDGCELDITKESSAHQGRTQKKMSVSSTESKMSVLKKVYRLLKLSRRFHYYNIILLQISSVKGLQKTISELPFNFKVFTFNMEFPKLYN